MFEGGMEPVLYRRTFPRHFRLRGNDRETDCPLSNVSARPQPA
jgi:hypothetical protein